MVGDADLYQAWLSQYSSDGNPLEALAAVRKEVEDLIKEQPPLEVRVAALERFVAVWTDFVLSMFYVDEIWQMPPTHVVARSTEAVEFLRLAALSQAIQLDRLANEREEK